MTTAERDHPDPKQPGQATPQEIPVEVTDQAMQEELPSDPEELREQIAQTREELGETVEALAARADVKGRAKDKFAEGKEHLEEKVNLAKTKVAEAADNVSGTLPEPAQRAFGEVKEQARQRPWAPIAAAAAMLMLLIRRRAKRRRR